MYKTIRYKPEHEFNNLQYQNLDNTNRIITLEQINDLTTYYLPWIPGGLNLVSTLSTVYLIVKLRAFEVFQIILTVINEV